MLESAVHALMKLCIAVGVVVVGGMAYHLYGPPAGEASALLDRIVCQARRELNAWQGAPASRPAPLSTPAATPAPALAAAPPADLIPLPGAAQAPLNHSMAPLEPLPPTPDLSPEPLPADVQPLVAQLQQLGVQDIQLTAWGAEGALHRFACCAPLPGGSGFVRHFDAIEPNAQLAAARVIDQVRRWRVTNPVLTR